MTLKAPFAPFLSSLTCADGGAITPKHIGETDPDVRKNPKINQSIVGTGPFIFKEWVPGDHITLTKNPNYWKPGLPYLDQIVLKIIPDTSSMILALRAGEINYINDFFVNSESVVQVQNDPKINIISATDAPTFQMVQINHRRPPLDKPDVRKALYQAVDRDLILKNVYRGYGRFEPNMIDNLLAVAADPSVDITKQLPYDVAAANKLLDSAGVPRQADGTRLNLKMTYEAARGDWKEIAEIMRTNWEQLGIKLTMEPLERAVMLDKVFTKRDFDLTLQTYNSRGDPALGATRAYACESDTNPPTFGNPTGYCNKQVDQLFEQAAQQPDFEKRHALYQQAQKILAQDFPIIVFMGDQTITLTDKIYDFSVPHTATSQSSGWEYVHKK
jgi:peptide/nickel transport system substrate-binding protein